MVFTQDLDFSGFLLGYQDFKTGFSDIGPSVMAKTKKKLTDIGFLTGFPGYGFKVSLIRTLDGLTY